MGLRLKIWPWAIHRKSLFIQKVNMVSGSLSSRLALRVRCYIIGCFFFLSFRSFKTCIGKKTCFDANPFGFLCLHRFIFNSIRCQAVLCRAAIAPVTACTLYASNCCHLEKSLPKCLLRRSWDFTSTAQWDPTTWKKSPISKSALKNLFCNFVGTT